MSLDFKKIAGSENLWFKVQQASSFHTHPHPKKKNVLESQNPKINGYLPKQKKYKAKRSM